MTCFGRKGQTRRTRTASHRLPGRKEQTNTSNPTDNLEKLVIVVDSIQSLINLSSGVRFRLVTNNRRWKIPENFTLVILFFRIRTAVISLEFLVHVEINRKANSVRLLYKTTNRYGCFNGTDLRHELRTVAYAKRAKGPQSREVHLRQDLPLRRGRPSPESHRLTFSTLQSTDFEVPPEKLSS